MYDRRANIKFDPEEASWLEGGKQEEEEVKTHTNHTSAEGVRDGSDFLPHYGFNLYVSTTVSQRPPN